MKHLPVSPKKQAAKAWQSVRRFVAPLFILFLVATYGFLGWRIISLTSVEPDQSAVTEQLKTRGVPEVDPETVRKMQQLEDNSVNVQTLFDEARDNPFQEPVAD